MITESLAQRIDEGRSGLNAGFSMGLPKLERIVSGVSQGIYTLIFGGTGTGKTIFAMYSYVYRPLMEHMDDDLFKVIYFSLEMSPELLYAKLLSMYIFEHYAMVISTTDMFSRRKDHKLNDKEYNIIQECLPWLRRVEDKVIVHDEAMNASKFYSMIMQELKKDGTFNETVDGRKTTYTPHNPNRITVVVIDHMNLVQRSQGHSLKEEIDIISNYLISLRNRCRISPVVLMQVNRDSTSMGRRKEGLTNLRLDDAKDSGSPANDCDIALALFSPHREALTSYKGYDIRRLKQNFRVITCRKNRFDNCDLEIGCAFYGEISRFEELPLPDDIVSYSKYEAPWWIINKLVDQLAREQQEYNNNNNFNDLQNEHI